MARHPIVLFTRSAVPVALSCGIALACGMLASCRDGNAHASQDLRERTDLHAVLWMQTAAEYRASCLATFRAAKTALDDALQQTNTSAALEQGGQASELPPAIVVDVDETVLDNSAYNARMLVDPSRPQFDPDTWKRWVGERRAKPLPGAVPFLQHAAQAGVTVFYVTNRDHTLEEDTRANLRAVGGPLPAPLSDNTEALDVVLTRNDHDDAGSEKTQRRQRVTQTHRVIMMFGDDLGDFVPFARKKSTAEREAITDEHASRWGRQWFVLPNPIYGSWWRTLGDDPESALRLDRDA